MTKRELIDEILQVNTSAKPEFLAQFRDEQLDEYLQHLQSAHGPRPTGTDRSGRGQRPIDAMWDPSRPRTDWPRPSEPLPASAAWPTERHVPAQTAVLDPQPPQSARPADALPDIADDLPATEEIIPADEPAGNLTDDAVDVDDSQPVLDNPVEEDLAEDITDTADALQAAEDTADDDEMAPDEVDDADGVLPAVPFPWYTPASLVAGQVPAPAAASLARAEPEPPGPQVRVTAADPPSQVRQPVAAAKAPLPISAQPATLAAEPAPQQAQRPGIQETFLF